RRHPEKLRVQRRLQPLPLQLHVLLDPAEPRLSASRVARRPASVPRCRRAIFNRLEPRTCPNAAPATVCASVRGVGSDQDGFRFTDGCNRFACAPDGSVAGSTWRSCIAGNARRAYCSFIVEAQIDAAGESLNRSSVEEFSTANVECPELHPSTFCSDDDIPRNFEYSDGCSRYRCNFMSYSTLQSRDCPRAESLADQRRCRDVARAIFNRLEPRTCPNAAPATVCASVRGVGSDQDGFRFTDGCNRFACAPDGSVAGSTWRSCIAGNARRAYCSFIVEAQIDASGESLNRSSVELFDGKRGVPRAAPSTFCSDDDIPRNFEYSDGCSRYRCNFMSYSTLQSRDCPRAESLADQRRCRDVARAIFSRLEPRTCPNAAPATVCASVKGVGSDQDGFRFTDGCNRFACAPDGSVAGSTWRSCIAGNARRAYCSFIERDQQVDGMEVG
uniref:Thyroglobulin type-1 domain-containing protein n=1 Tax=Macrostomum lignano TaxID=282301 RepID=A0A1I8G6F3_9PLAT